MSDKPTVREIRAWAERNGVQLPRRLPEYVLIAWNKAHPDRQVMVSPSYARTHEELSEMGQRGGIARAVAMGYRAPEETK